jgi:hypothetical protein
MLARLLEHDLRESVCKHLSREEAGVLLAPLCKAAAALVRELDADDDAVDADVSHVAALATHLQPSPLAFDLIVLAASRIARVWRWQPQPHSPTRVLLRLQRAAHQRGWPPVLRAELYNLATQLHALRDAGVVRFVLDRRAGCRPSLFGYHELVVRDPEQFFIRLHAWASKTLRDKETWLKDRSVLGFTRTNNVAAFIRNLLRLVDLRPVSTAAESLNPLANPAYRMQSQPARRSARLAAAAPAPI